MFNDGEGRGQRIRLKPLGDPSLVTHQRIEIGNRKGTHPLFS